jgi:hypothetical protein
MELIKENISIERVAGKRIHRRWWRRDNAAAYETHIGEVLAVEGRVNMGNMGSAGRQPSDGRDGYVQRRIPLSAKKELNNFESASMFKHSVEMVGRGSRHDGQREPGRSARSNLRLPTCVR